MAELTENQSEFFASDAIHTCFCGGLGSGKTYGLITRMLYDKLRLPEFDLLYGAPTYPLIRDVAVPIIHDILDEWGIAHRISSQPAELVIPGAGRVLFRSLEHHHRIVGFPVAHFYYDEFDLMKTEEALQAFRRGMARARARLPNKERNRGWIGTTPEGFKAAYQLFSEEADSTVPRQLIRAPTKSNPHLPEDYEPSLRATYPANLVDAYLEGRFVNLTHGRVYPMYDRELNWTDAEPQEGERLHIGQDFNVYYMASIVHVIRQGKAHAVGELIDLADTPKMLEAVDEKYPKNPKTFYPDSTGAAHKTVGASKSDIDLIRAAGHEIRAPNKNPPPKDRIVSMNAGFCNAEEYRRYLVNPKLAPKYTAALEQHAYGDNGLPDKPGGPTDMSHRTEAGGYFYHYTFPVVRRSVREVRI